MKWKDIFELLMCNQQIKGFNEAGRKIKLVKAYINLASHPSSTNLEWVGGRRFKVKFQPKRREVKGTNHVSNTL